MRADEISERARAIHFSSLVFDTHADTPQRLFFDQFDLAHRDPEGCVDIPRLREGGVGAIFFALWVPVEIKGAAATRRARDLLARHSPAGRAARLEISLWPDRRAKCAPREQRTRSPCCWELKVGTPSITISRLLREFHDLGVRYMTLTHNASTDWADASNDSPRHHGLTEFGKQVIREMNRLGMLVDVSHVSDSTFYDVLKTSEAPVIASHSCCRALCDAPRNLDDDMIRALASRGGVLHITFHDGFLSQEYATANRALSAEIASNETEVAQKYGENEARNLMELQRRSDEFIRAGRLPQVSWEKIVEHIDHAVHIAGVEHVGVGSDFDGAFMPAGMEDAAGFPRITDGLLRRGYTEDGIQKILGENTLRVMDQARRVSEFSSRENS